MSTRKPPFLRLVGTDDQAKPEKRKRRPRRTARQCAEDFAAFEEARTQLMEKNGLSFEAASTILGKERLQRERDTLRPTPAITEESPNEQNDREARSPAIKAAVRYIAAMAGLHEGFKADHTFHGVVAGFNDEGLAATQLRVARRQLNKLTLSCRLSQDASPVEMASKASVAKFIMAQWRSKIWEVDQDKYEGLFLDAFTEQAEKVFKDLYQLECHAMRLGR